MENLAKLKKEYEKLEQKYKLPSFKLLNEEFCIEKAAEQETETLLREIRKLIMDKAISYFRFIEMLTNPAAAPMFFLSLVKGLDSADQKIIDELYGKLGKLELRVVAVDNSYSEKTEAEFIKQVYGEWQEIKENMAKLSNSLEKCWDKKSEKKEKSYLG